MINKKIIYKILGSLLFIEAALLMACLGLAFYYEEPDVIAFLIAVATTMFFGFAFQYLGRNAENTLSRRDAYLVVTLSWVLFSLFGTLPFLISGHISSFTDAYFETMSGFTTTGATIIDNVEILPHGLLFWRSLTQWIGGLGIVFFTIALLPSLVGGSTRVFAAEATGPIKSKLHPRLSVSAKWIWVVYLVLTAACIGSYLFFGMTPWEAVNYSMTTTATGGFAIHNASIAYFHSPSLEYVSTLICFLSGVNFTLLYFSVAKLRFRALFRNTEFRFYFFITAICTAFIMVELIMRNHYNLEHAFRSSIFQVVSFLTTTGLFSEDASTWPHITWVVLAICMFFGASSGSTSGGIKAIRGLMILKVVRNEFMQILHPNAVLPMKVDGVNISQQKRVALFAFFATYLILCLLISSTIIIAGVDSTNAITITLSCLGNVGPTLGIEIGPTMSWSMLPDFAKWMCSAMMLIGRLEIFTVLVIFSPEFWRKN